MRPELSKKNEYYIPKERYLELKHFCMQYKDWKKACRELDELGLKSSSVISVPSAYKKTVYGSTTETVALCKMYYAEKIRLVCETATRTDAVLGNYILKGVTEGVPYHSLRARYSIPCSRTEYYILYRKFFWLIDHAQFLQSL